MRHVFVRGGLVLPGALSLVCLGASLLTAEAAGFAIDPDPNSMTLGEILDREKLANAPRPALKPIPASATTTMPVVPQGAATVLAPRVRSREPVRLVYPLPPERR